MSKHGIIKRNIIWSEAKILCDAYKVPLNSYVHRKLEICEALILKQQYEKIQLIENQDAIRKSLNGRQF